MAMQRAFGRSPTFLVNTEQQRSNLDALVRREQHLAEQYQKNKPLMFNGNAYQKTHPQKAVLGHRDADATVVSPMLLGCADGVSQIEEFGIDASKLPRELLDACEEQAMNLLVPDQTGQISGAYQGPIPLLREAFKNTRSLGSTTVCLSVLDNSTRIHGKLHPMMAIISVGDCELMVLRQSYTHHRGLRYETVFNTEMQRIDGNCQCPLQVCRVDDRIDGAFDERMTIEVIERGSAVHMVSVYEGDLVIIGSDGVFDNLFKDEVVQLVNRMIPRSRLTAPAAHAARKGEGYRPLEQQLLGEVAQRIVELCHSKTQADFTGKYPETPIGKGGKRDDTCCAVGEVIEWTEVDCLYWERIQRQRRMKELVTCGGILGLNLMCIDDDDDEDDDESVIHGGSRSARDYSFMSEEESHSCSVM